MKSARNTPRVVHPVVRELRRIRLELGWSVRDLADRSGWHPNSIYNIEGGSHCHGSLPMLTDLAQAMGYRIAIVPVAPVPPLIEAPPPEPIIDVPPPANEQGPTKHYRSVHAHTGQPIKPPCHEWCQAPGSYSGYTTHTLAICKSLG